MKISRLFLTGQTFSAIAAGSALPIVLAAALAMGTTAANAVEILSFGQAIAGQDPVSATADSPASGETTISTHAEVSVTDCLGCGLLISPQFLDLSAVSVGSAFFVGGNVAQDFKGTFSITAGSVNILSGTFTDAVFGSGTALGLSASNFSKVLTFTSDVIPGVDLHNPEGMSFSFADVTPAVHITPSGTLGSAHMSVSGTFSATPIPEPATWVMLGLGFISLGYAAVRRSAKDKSAIAI
jgi:hypothetical protein